MDPSRYESRHDAGAYCVQACYWIGKYALEDREKKVKNEKYALKDILTNFSEDFQVKDHPFTDEKKIVINSNAKVLVECLIDSMYLKFDESEQTILNRFSDLLHISKLLPPRGTHGYIEKRFTTGYL